MTKRILIGALLLWGVPGCVDATGGSADVPGPSDAFIDPDGDTGGADPDAGRYDPPSGACEPGTVLCAGPSSTQVCIVTGDEWQEVPCPEGLGCLEGACAEMICTPLQTMGICLTDDTYERCNEAGTAYEEVDCGLAAYCYLGTCIPQLCEPGVSICKGFSQLKVCNEDGTAWVDGDMCPPGSACLDGSCLSPCDVNIKDGSYLGCEYWAMDLDNVEEAEFQDVGVVVSVPTNKAATTVTIVDTVTGAELSTDDLGVVSLDVSPGGTKIFKLPLGHDVDGTMLTNRTFKIETTSPVVVHQFNPLNGEGVYTNDASLLLPSKVTGQEYLVMAWPHRNDTTTLRGFAAIIASQPGETEVEVTPTSAVVASEDGTVGQMQAGQTYTFVLQQGQALNLETDGATGSDLTGTRVLGSQRLSVIAGHECANVPLGISACDHLEQQLFPVETWSTEYVADTFASRDTQGHQMDVWRIMAGENDVTVITTPPVDGYELFMLQRGGWVEFATPADAPFHVSATGKILVGHYLTGSSYPGADIVCLNTGIGKDTAIGDPAFTLAAPVKRYLDEYAVLTPTGYDENYFNIIAPVGAEVSIDGAVVSTDYFTEIPGSGYALARPGVTPGVHTVTSNVPFGLTAYGYDCDVSYAYPGGLKLQAF